MKPWSPIWRLLQGALFRKYVALFIVVVGSGLVAESLVNAWFIWRQYRADLGRFQQEQASTAAYKITRFVREIESQLGWMTHLSWSISDGGQRALDAQRLLRQVPAVTELTLVDGSGREQLRLSRQAMDRVGSQADLSSQPAVKAAMASRVYFGAVTFRRQTEPYMTIAVAGPRRDTGVCLAEINLTHIWDVVSQIGAGHAGRAYVVDGGGRLIAHPDISLVLRNTSMSGLPQFRDAGRSAEHRPGSGGDTLRVGRDLHGGRVLVTHARAEPLDWLVFVEVPEREANRPLVTAMWRSLAIVIAGTLLSFAAALVLARRMVVPIETLSTGASLIGAGALGHRIDIRSGDELEALGAQFNRMARQLERSYATLESKVDERTRDLQIANQAKSRFLAAASHDLRQPLHALNLFAAQLAATTDGKERRRLTGRIEVAIGSMNQLFNALLDISRLDAGALQPDITVFAIGDVLRRIETTFTAAATEKGLHLAVVACRQLVCSDALLLERILLNLVANAIRYTGHGGVVVGCRREGDRVRIDVCDSGIGIAADQQRRIFDEFYRGHDAGQRHSEGLGLGLAIVDRLCHLLGHPLTLASTPGKGSRFSVSVPLASRIAARHGQGLVSADLGDPLRGKRVVVVEDDEMVRDGMRGLLAGWGCDAVVAEAAPDALRQLGDRTPDLLISDFHLGDGEDGITVIAELRRAFHRKIPAFLVSGDISSERLHEAHAIGLRLLHKPVDPAALRAVMTSLLVSSEPDGT